MPAGLVVVNATGIISSSNPAAEHVLGIHGLGFRRYSEALGQDSQLTKLVAECLASGRIFRREEVEHVPPAGDARHLGVTISPIRRGEGKINGVICLLTDLTELAALSSRCADVFVDEKAVDAIAFVRKTFAESFQISEADCDAMMNEISTRTR